METGFACAAFLALILNLILPEEMEDEETPELTANEIDSPADQAEWNRIRQKSRPGSDDSITNVDIHKGVSDGAAAPGIEKRID